MESKQSIFSAIPGIFYRRPNPNEEEYVTEGQFVKAGDPIGLIEVMKNFYEVTAEHDGIVEYFTVENEQLVDAGQEVAILNIKK